MRTAFGLLCLLLAPSVAQAAEETTRCERLEGVRALIEEIAPQDRSTAARPIDLPEGLRGVLDGWTDPREA